MKKFRGMLFIIAIFVLAKFNLLEQVSKPIIDVFVWLFTLSLTQSPVSIAGEIFVKIATFAVSFSAVGAFFNTIGWFNSAAMKITYFVISTLVSFALCYVVMLFETYMLQIAIAILITSVGIVTGFFIHRHFSKTTNNRT